LLLLVQPNFNLAFVEKNQRTFSYQEDFSKFHEFDRTQNGSARVIYANKAATAVQPDQPIFPYGSVLVMEVHRTQRKDGSIATATVAVGDGSFCSPEYG
jgi:hypothetical protein